MLFLKKLQELPPSITDFIRFSGQVADQTGVRAYIVGGFVRDLFLNVANYDVDIVVEGSGIAFAETLASRLGLPIVTHKRFGTATLTLEGFKVDIATARRETYEKPAVLPTVAEGSIQDDLFRRDFTINAMAISINAAEYGKILDLYGGLDDLKKHLIRALHSASFMDDPTRILRAVRFEQRFDFKIEKQTLSWIKAASRQRMLGVVGKHRLRDELVLIFKEKAPLKALRRLYALSGFGYIAPSLRFHNIWPGVFLSVEKRVSWYRQHFSHKRHIEPYAMYLALFFYSLDVKEIKKVMLDFAFHKGESSRAVSLRENFLKIEKELKAHALRPSAVYRLLEHLSYEVILLFMVLSRHKRVLARIEDFLFVYNGSRLHIRGEDLTRLGAKPGPRFKKIMEELLFAKIDGKVRDREEELALAEKLVRQR